MRFDGSYPTFLRTVRYLPSDGMINDYLHAPRPFYSLAYMEKGGAEIKTPKGSFSLKEGDVLFIPVSTVYLSCWKGDPRVQFLSCHFSLPSKNPLLRKKYEVQAIRGDDAVHEALCYLFREGKREGAEFSLLSRFCFLMEWLQARVEGEEDPALDPRLQLAERYIRDNLERGFSVEELASHCHMSASHFYSCFRGAFGTSPIEYKNRLAIELAERLLCQDPSLSVERVSELTGFSSSSYFRRVFHEVTGKSPRQYRKDALGGLQL